LGYFGVLSYFWGYLATSGAKCEVIFCSATPISYKKFSYKPSTSYLAYCLRSDAGQMTDAATETEGSHIVCEPNKPKKLRQMHNVFSEVITRGQQLLGWHQSTTKIFFIKNSTPTPERRMQKSVSF